MSIHHKTGSLVAAYLFTALGFFAASAAILIVVLTGLFSGAPKAFAAESDANAASVYEDVRLSPGWHDVAGGEVVYVDPDGSYHVGWLVTNRGQGEGLQRYWFDQDGTLSKGELINAGKDGWAYATPSGAVVRGKYDNGRGRVYLANNDGRLADGAGWIVTGNYDGGILQRYYIDSNDHAACSGYFSVDGESYFGLGGQGYVLRGAGWGVRGDQLLADNDGVLAVSKWVVADVFGQGLQRYWFDSAGAMAKGRLVDPSEGSGYWAYATDQGSILRGTSSEGEVKRFADNDGRISDGWLVTGAFTGGALERYWQEGGQIAVGRLIDAGGGWWAYASTSGAVVRGRLAVDGKVYLANNDGRLENTGWLVTDAYGQGLQRYYIDTVEHAAIVGFADSDYASYTTSGGYVLRGKMNTDNGVLVADNDGALIENGRSEGWCVTDAYDGGPQRYYLQDVGGRLYAKTDFFQAESDIDGKVKWFYAAPENAYVVRGKTVHPSGVLVADNDGVLIENQHGQGWCVTDVYDGGPQRYYLQDVGGHLYAKTGLFSARLHSGAEEKQFYGLDNAGYVARNSEVVVEGSVYSTDNDGVLTWLRYSSQTRDPTLATVSWANDYGYLDKTKALASQYGSSTNWFIAVDDKLCRVVVLQRSGSSWNVAKTWNCNGGRNAYRWIGDHEIVHRSICNWDDSYFGKGYNDWSTCFIESYSSDSQGHLRYVPGKGYEDCASFHSTGYTWTGWDNAGCIGLIWDNAKWIYDNIPNGTNMCLFNPRI